jgi:hypothetical protein
MKMKVDQTLLQLMIFAQMSTNSIRSNHIVMLVIVGICVYVTSMYKYKAKVMLFQREKMSSLYQKMCLDILAFLSRITLS